MRGTAVVVVVALVVVRVVVVVRTVVGFAVVAFVVVGFTAVRVVVGGLVVVFVVGFVTVDGVVFLVVRVVTVVAAVVFLVVTVSDFVVAFVVFAAVFDDTVLCDVFVGCFVVSVTLVATAVVSVVKTVLFSAEKKVVVDNAASSVGSTINVGVSEFGFGLSGAAFGEQEQHTTVNISTSIVISSFFIRFASFVNKLYALCVDLARMTASNIFFFR